MGISQYSLKLKKNLRRLTPQEFERVLHPVFEEDELTLIVVGAVLGLAVGWAQMVQDARSRQSRPDAQPPAQAEPPEQAPGTPPPEGFDWGPNI